MPPATAAASAFDVPGEAVPRSHRLSDRGRQTLLSLARYAMPPGKILPGADERCVRKTEELLATLDPNMLKGLEVLLLRVELAPLARYGRRLSKLPAARRDHFLSRWRKKLLANELLVRGVLIPLKVMHFEDEEIFGRLGCVYKAEEGKESAPRYMGKVMELGEAEEGEEIEVDAVVVGTGAGGAPVAHGLAAAGYAVLMLEEGRYHTRADFAGTRVEGARRSYRRMGTTATIGNAFIPVPLGRGVGGTTTINSGTCFRTPDTVLKRWVAETGLSLFEPDAMAPYFERVEEVLRVEEASPRYLSGVARAIARGCDRLGYTHRPLKRNAPDCDGKGFCAFGCPTDAKRSTNVSYVPMALEQGAYLFTRARVKKVLVEGGRAVGVVAETRRADGRKARYTVRARAVVLSCGTIMTPPLLIKNGLLLRNRNLGRNLTIHPATAMFAIFDEEIRGWDGIPQGYSIEELHREGLLYEGGFTPLDVATLTIPFDGREFMEVMEAFNRLAVFGFLVTDTGRGRVLPGPAGIPLIFYNLHRRDIERIKAGITFLWRVYKEAGASRVITGVRGHAELSERSDLERFRRSKIRAGQLEMSAYHPLGTSRLGADARRGLVGEDHQAHGLPGLYIVDGGNLPGSPTVNPQVTIMALAGRAADRIAERLG